MEKPYDRTMGEKARSQWLRRILFSFWICRILLLVVMSVAQVAAVYWISQALDMRGTVLASLVVVVLFTVLCISLDAVSMILLGRNALTPKSFLAMQVLEITLWTVVVGVEVMAAVTTSSRIRSFLTWFICAILYIAFLGSLLYAAIVFHRSRHAISYASAEYVNFSEHSLPQRLLSPANPFENAHPTHSRGTSVASIESVYPAPPPYASNLSIPLSSNSFIIITPPESVVIKVSHSPNMQRSA